MKLWIGLVIATLASACGSSGNNGRDGKDGKSAKCVTVEKGKKTYLRCVNPDGTVFETELPNPEDGTDGRDGQDAILGAVSCSLDWALDGGTGFKVAYNILQFKNGSVLASLHHYHYIGDVTDFHTSSSAVFTKENPENAAAKLENNLWAASRNGSSAKLVYKVLGQSKDMVCKQQAQ